MIKSEMPTMKRQTILITLLAAILASSCDKLLLGPEAQQPPPTHHASTLATVLDSMRYALDLPALAGAIMTDTGIVDAQAVGCRRYGGTANVTVNDQFHLGSCGKSFTAVLMGLLVDEGKIQWTTTLPEIFPEYSATMRAEYRDVNLLNILSHTAGFRRDPSLTLQSTTPRDQRAEVAAWAMLQPPVVARGQESYSNMGFVIAGAIIEKLTDRSYEDLVVEKVIRPLGITTAGFGAMGTEGLEDQPLQHSPNHAPLLATPNAHLLDIENSAGGLYMSIGDWARYCRWVLACEAGHPSLLSAQSARTITTPYVVMDARGGGSALGWGVDHWVVVGGRTLNHTGSNGFTYAQVLLVPDHHYGVIVMTNQGSGTVSNPIWPVVVRLIQLYQNGQ
jgi:CubicO group peptidase (beta-lactamase class C family)